MRIASARGVPPFGALLAVLALLSQLVLGSLVLPDTTPSQAVDRLASLMVLCGPAHHAPHPDQPRHHGGQADCPLAVALALPGVILSDPILVPPRVLMRIGRAVMLPPPRAPPPWIIPDAAPRGPPVP